MLPYIPDLCYTAGMEQRQVFLVLIDISGYTRFTRLHRLSAMHAEQIISDLLESIIQRASHPLVVHEILGDSVNFFAIADSGRQVALEIRRQVTAIFEAFRLREGELISDCSLCVCQACVNVGKLHLKAVLHCGQAIFTNISGFRKIAGEDVILAHRLLKNSVPEKEYVLETEAFHQMAGASTGIEPEARVERFEDLGEVRVRVSYPGDQRGPARGSRRSLLSKLRMSARNDIYYLKRLFSRSERPFQNIGAVPQLPAASATALFAARTHRQSTEPKSDE
jgi:class 3 adenylate cyclase